MGYLCSGLFVYCSVLVNIKDECAKLLLYVFKYFSTKAFSHTFQNILKDAAFLNTAKKI